MCNTFLFIMARSEQLLSDCFGRGGTRDAGTISTRDKSSYKLQIIIIPNLGVCHVKFIYIKRPYDTEISIKKIK